MTTTETLDPELAALDAYWRASNYLAVGQIYLLDNPLLAEELQSHHVKPRLLGHWGTTPGLNLIYTHLNRLINAHDLNMIYLAGPGHGGPAVVAQTYLEGSYSDTYPEVSRDAEGMRRLFKQFSFPGGIPSHVAPEIPGSIHEGGELGYSLSHAYGAVFDNPDLIAACVIGDGEAETGPLAASWHSGKFINPARDGAVLPILHLNGYKIANPTVLARIPRDHLEALFVGNGYAPIFVAGSDPATVHRDLASALDTAVTKISEIQADARDRGRIESCQQWPAIVLETPKGWTGPKEVDGHLIEGSWRSHQVPLGDARANPEQLLALQNWMLSYRPHELFDNRGRLREELGSLAPTGARRMGSNPHTNGGTLRRPLVLPDVAEHAIEVKHGITVAEATKVAGTYLRDVFAFNAEASNFRLFGPDETASNRLSAVFDATGKAWLAEPDPEDPMLVPDGRVMEILSEHTLQGWLEGYLLTGRHGLFSTYEAFVHIVSSMFNQHAKWLKTTSKEIPWRAPIASLNYLLTSHVWRQDHNGFSHQDPGFLDHVVNKCPDVIRTYLPPDANTLLCVVDDILASTNRVNVVVAGKQPALQYLTLDEAKVHCEAGLGIWPWASTDAGEEPDLVMACAGDVPTLEALAATDFLRTAFPELRIRFINVVDLMKLQPSDEHPAGLTDSDYERLFTSSAPVIFAFHGYPWLIHRLTYRRANQHNLHVRGYKEEGSTTTPFDMVVRNDLDRFQLAADALERLPQLGTRASHVLQEIRDTRVRHRYHIRDHGEDLPEVTDWRWRGETRPVELLR